MTANIKASVSCNSTGIKNPFNHGYQKAQSVFDFNHKERLAQEQKRDVIFRSFISYSRNERFKPNGQHMDHVFDLPKLDHSKNFGSLDQDQLWKIGVCAVPNFILNALICEQLQKDFGDLLSICGCFYKVENCWRLDVDQALAKRGLLLPLRAAKTGLIYALKVFRYPDDPNPFTLKLRGGLSG